MVDTEARGERLPPHTGPTNGSEPGTHRQAASWEGGWVQRPPFIHGFPSRQGDAVQGQRKMGGQPGTQEPQLRVTGPILPSPRQQLQRAGGVSVGAWRPASTVPTAPRPGPSCWGCSCPCQLKPWEPQGRGGQEEVLTCARCGDSGSCQNGGC